MASLAKLAAWRALIAGSGSARIGAQQRGALPPAARHAPQHRNKRGKTRIARGALSALPAKKKTPSAPRFRSARLPSPRERLMERLAAWRRLQVTTARRESGQICINIAYRGVSAGDGMASAS